MISSSVLLRHSSVGAFVGVSSSGAVRTFSKPAVVPWTTTTMWTTTTTKTMPYPSSSSFSSPTGSSVSCRRRKSKTMFAPSNGHQSFSSMRLFSTSSDEDDKNNDSAEKNNKARIVFLGTPDVAASSLRAIVEESKKENCNYEVVGVVTQPPKRRGRRGKVTASPVGAVAEELEIPVLCPEKAKDPVFLDELEQTVRPDLCITAAYGQYLPKRFLGLPRYGTLNIHPSLLPRWRGASPVQRSLEAGDDPLGVSVLFTVSKMDAGPLVSQTAVAFAADDQATTVLPRLFAVGTKSLLAEVLPRVLAGAVTPDRGSTVQDDADATAASLIRAAEGELAVWAQTARACHDKVRGFSMWPGTFMYLRIGDDDPAAPPVKVKIIETRVAGNAGSAEPTDVVEIPPKQQQKGPGLHVICHDGSVLEIVRIQPLTKKTMDAKSFVNGLRGQTLRWARGPVSEEETT